MAESALQTSELLPRVIISALAFGCDPAHLAALDPRVEPGSRGWSLLIRNHRTTQTAIAAFATALELDPGGLRKVDDAKRLGVSTRPLGNQMINYLVRRDFSNEADALPMVGERMVVVADLPRSALIALLNQLNMHATCVRAAVLEQAQGNPLSLFHLRDDVRRGSTLEAFLSAYRGQKVPVLNAYGTAQGTAFLPVAPPRDSLAGVAQLIALAPTIFGRPSPVNDGWKPEALLFAITRNNDQPGESGRTLDVWHDIRNSRFFGSAALASAFAQPDVAIAVPVADAERAITRLRERLADPDGEFAMPITLREAQMPQAIENDANEITALEAERRLLDRRLRAIRAGKPRPSMMVVAPEIAFPVVASLLQKIARNDEQWDDISYAYLPRAPGATTSNRHDPHHVFHFGPAVSHEVNLRAALRRNGALAFYWSDPGWTQHYRTTARIEMLVPWQRQLHPLPHGWEAQDMDAHLRQMVEVWSGGSIALPPGEAQVLLFLPPTLPGSDARGATLRLEVFRQGDLQPLTGRTLTWFNAVLAQTGARQDDDMRLQWETVEARAVAAKQMAQRSDEHRASIQSASEALAEHSREAWNGVLGALDADLASRMAEIRQRAADIEEIERLANALEASLVDARERFADIRLDASRFADQARKLPERQTAEIDAFMAALVRKEGRFNTAIKTSGETISRMRAALVSVRKGWFGDG